MVLIPSYSQTLTSFGIYVTTPKPSIWLLRWSQAAGGYISMPHTVLGVQRIDQQSNRGTAGAVVVGSTGSTCNYHSCNNTIHHHAGAGPSSLFTQIRTMTIIVTEGQQAHQVVSCRNDSWKLTSESNQNIKLALGRTVLFSITQRRSEEQQEHWLNRCPSSGGRLRYQSNRTPRCGWPQQSVAPNRVQLTT